MTPTEELLALLDKRGIKYDAPHAGFTIVSTDNAVCKFYERLEEPELGVFAVINTDWLTPEQAVETTLGREVTGETSDGYHTFNELYHHRAVLFSVIVRDHRELAWKSKAHHDGTMYDGMFIVGIETPEGQATYHYDIDPYWDMFDCKELERAPEWDGHTPDEAIERIATLGRGTCHLEINTSMTAVVCDRCNYPMPRGTVLTEVRFCPNCGRKVVSE